MKNIVFDTGPIISLATNNLLDILDKLKESFQGDFYLTNGVKEEAIDRPLDSKKFKFEALQVLKKVQEGVFKMCPDNLEEKTKELLMLANNIFMVKGNYIQIVHYAEMEVLAAALEHNASAVIIDERTTRVLIENPLKVKERLQKKLHTSVDVNKHNLLKLKKQIGKINVLRSFELATIAYEKGFLKEYLIDIKNSRQELLEGVLWGVKLQGCSVSEDEINHVLKLEKVV